MQLNEDDSFYCEKKERKKEKFGQTSQTNIAKFVWNSIWHHETFKLID